MHLALWYVVLSAISMFVKIMLAVCMLVGMVGGLSELCPVSFLVAGERAKTPPNDLHISPSRFSGQPQVMETLILPPINKYILLAPDQHGFIPEHSTTSALMQLTTYIAMGFNQRKPPDRTFCMAVDLSTAFDGCHNNRLSKINGSQLPLVTTRWLSCDLRGRQTKLSPSLFSFYIADMPRPTEPVKRVCYDDDITMWTTRVKILKLEDSLNSYIDEITAYLKDNSILISAPKSSVTWFTPDTHQAKTPRKYP